MIDRSFRLIAALAAIGCVSVSASAGAGTFPRPIVSVDRKFVVLAPESVTRVAVYGSVEVLVFDRALSECDLTVAELAGETETKLRLPLEGSAFATLFPRARERLGQSRVRVLIDAFTPEQLRMFAKFHVRDVPGRGESVIGLDCHAISRRGWLADYQHELTHALLADQGLPSWWEELVAQLLESESGGLAPERMLQALSSVADIPSLQTLDRPLPSDSHYALAYLFGKYLIFRQGGWSLVARMLAAGPFAREPRLEQLLPADKDSRAVLEGFFTELLSRVPEQRLPGWTGFDSQTIYEIGPNELAARELDSQKR